MTTKIRRRRRHQLPLSEQVKRDPNTRTETNLVPVSEEMFNDQKALTAYARGRARDFAIQGFEKFNPGYRVVATSYAFSRKSKYFSKDTPHVRTTVLGRRGPR